MSHPDKPTNTFKDSFVNSAAGKPPRDEWETCGRVLFVLLFVLALRPLLLMFVYNVGIDAIINGHQAIDFWAALALSIGLGVLAGLLKRS